MSFFLWAEMLSSSAVSLESADTLSVSDSADLKANATLSATDTLSVSDLADLLAGSAFASAESEAERVSADSSETAEEESISTQRKKLILHS